MDSLKTIAELFHESSKLVNLSDSVKQGLENQKKILEKINQKMPPGLKIIEVDLNARFCLYDCSAKMSAYHIERTIKLALVEFFGEKALSWLLRKN